ncbi:hypothetical protein [Brevundimonas sp. ZS04]|uniref:5-methylcytosine restriction system specificity protein McrC n=1 Tax=Brevundimonas sp. ZS04 TaxID=1906854 RepID=UPI00096DBAAD|nr:hypothetical protein [Brevundimonas sp. ZS04]OMG58159.1 hypothetical protein BJP32_10335 [Brevundimonas sp. ZS04]
MTIPIRNLYYLFCYAWQRFPPGGAVEAGVDAAPDLPNLFARLLVNDVNALLRRGLDRGYRTFVEETRAPRGRLLLDAIVKEQTLRRGAVVCAIDELTPDIVHNRIVKAAARLLARTRGVEPALVHELGAIVLKLQAVSDVRLSADLFKGVQLSRNTRQYAPLMKLCELVWRAQMPDETGAGSRFADILKDEVTMSAVFEDFLRNFYAHHQTRYRVSREVMSWDAIALDEHSHGRLPIMETDITLRSRERTIVMDAKFYKETMVSRGGAGKVRSGHLYQLFAYLEHAGSRTPERPCDGVLIYPAVGIEIALRYRIRGHEVLVKTVNLDREWSEIHRELIGVPLTFDAPAPHPAPLAA